MRLVPNSMTDNIPIAGMSNAYRKFAEQMVDQLDYETESKVLLQRIPTL
ncbi:hypothetical protein RZN25_04655 [Bacillaceae bacterium S4-13-56]